MSNVNSSFSPYDMFYEWLSQRITPEEIIAFQAPQEARDHIQAIFDRRSAGKITPEEEAELQQVADFEDMILHIKIRAHSAINSRP